MKNIPYGHQWIKQRDIDEVVKVLKSDWLTQGKRIEDFENKVSKYCQAKYALCCSSGTSALHLAYLSCLNKGDEVITTPLTFSATSAAILMTGCLPVFVDIKKDTLNIDPLEIIKKITKKTKAISVVDFAGQPCDLDEIKAIAKKHNLFLIEDASHALGSKYKGKRIGSISDLTIFSFHPVKPITTGEGGMVLTNREDFYEKMKLLRSHGAVKDPKKGGWYYEIKELGYNYRMTDIQAALGQSQMKSLDSFIQRRKEIKRQYDKAFQDIEEIITLKGDFVPHIYPIQLKTKNRRKVFDSLKKEGILTQVHYLPLHLHPLYQKLGYKRGDFPKAEDYYKKAITLPLFPLMTNNDVQRVIKTIKKYV